MGAKKQIEKEVREAYSFLREKHPTLPSETLQFMLDSALEKLEELSSDEEPLEGFKTYRHGSNPKEKEFHDKFIKDNINSMDIDLLIFGHYSNSFTPKDNLTNREKKIVISAIQWLGSPVGIGFLDQCGFKEE